MIVLKLRFILLHKHLLNKTIRKCKYERYLIKKSEDCVYLKSENFSLPMCSAYQRLDAKKALIGITQVAYL